MSTLAAVMLGCFSALGVALTLLGLPGIWLMVLAALGVEAWRPELLSWTAIGTAAGLALAAEVAEFLAGAVGARKAGGSRRAALAAVAGGIVGGLVGTVAIPIPVVGTVLGAALGSGLAAAVGELTLEGKTLRDVRAVGVGAFIGRLLATVIKTMFAVATAAVLVVSSAVPGW
ncbi:MAG: DUF456 domain-containing protein [Planctomycetota bacterium]|nr:DUF456 domain-containing protein [Planctomycetota bacterium]